MTVLHICLICLPYDKHMTILDAGERDGVETAIVKERQIGPACPGHCGALKDVAGREYADGRREGRRQRAQHSDL